MVKKLTKEKNLQIQDTKFSFKFILISILLVLTVLLVLSSLLNFNKKETKEEKIETKNKIETFFSSDGSTRVKMYLPAVDTEGKGVNTVLTVEATKGSGRTLTDIDNLLFWADTQHSIRIARRVAENITGKNEKDYDIVYTIEANASLIGGPSAGAALAVDTIAALEGKNLKEDVMITGSSRDLARIETWDVIPPPIRIMPWILSEESFRTSDGKISLAMIILSTRSLSARIFCPAGLFLSILIFWP